MRVQIDKRPTMIFLSLILLLTLTMLSNENLSEQDNVSRILGKPTISFQYSDISSSSIDQIVSDNRFLYILYGEHDGNVQVFDLNGNYQYSAYFYTHLNGSFKIAAHNDMLYVRDKRRNVYCIKDGECVEFLAEADAHYYLNLLDFNAHSNNYQVRLGSVWKLSESGDTCIIQRPWYSLLYQNNLLFLLSIALVAVMGIIKKIKH